MWRIAKYYHGFRIKELRRTTKLYASINVSWWSFEPGTSRIHVQGVIGTQNCLLEIRVMGNKCSHDDLLRLQALTNVSGEPIFRLRNVHHVNTKPPLQMLNEINALWPFLQLSPCISMYLKRCPTYLKNSNLNFIRSSCLSLACYMHYTQR